MKYFFWIIFLHFLYTTGVKLNHSVGPKLYAVLVGGQKSLKTLSTAENVLNRKTEFTGPANVFVCFKQEAGKIIILRILFLVCLFV